MNWKRLASLQRESAHPGDEELLELLDGELDDNRAVEVREHLAGCWNCRARQAEFEQTVFAFVKGRNAALENFTQAPPQMEARLLARLQQTAQPQPPSVLARWQQWFQLSAALKLRLGVATGALILLAMVGFWLTRTPVVSAHELLARAERAEQNELARLVQPVTYRQVRVARRKTQQETTTVWESWREARGPRSQQRFAQTPEVQQELAHILTANQFEANSPLLVAAFTRWRQQARRLSETVTALNGAWRLTTTTVGPHARDAILEASLTVRRNDWHAISQSFKVQGEGETLEYELTELAFEVVPLQALVALATPPPTVAPTLAWPTPSLTTPSAAPLASPLLAPSASLPSAAALQEAEVTALYALHQLQADLGEQLEVVRDGNRQIIVRGLVEQAERKQQLIAALRAIPLVTPQIQTIEEAARQLKPAPAAQSVTTNELTVAATPQVNVFQQRLEHYFVQRGLDRNRASQQSAELSNAVVAEARAALSAAWALRRLSERFQSGEAQPRIAEMMRNHTARLRARQRKLQTQLEPLLTSIGGTVAPVITATPETMPQRVRQVFQSVEQLHSLTTNLFAGAGSASGTAETNARRLLSALQQMDSALRNFEQ